MIRKVGLPLVFYFPATRALLVKCANCVFSLQIAVAFTKRCEELEGGGVWWGNLYILKVAAAAEVRVNPLWAAADWLFAYTWPNESLIRCRGRGRQWVRAELSLRRAKLAKNKRSSRASVSSPFSIWQPQCSEQQLFTVFSISYITAAWWWAQQIVPGFKHMGDLLCALVFSLP